MAFNPNLIVAHEINKGFQSNEFPKWFYYYNLNNDAIAEDYIPYDDAYNYKYGNNSIFEIISSDSKTVGLKRLNLDHNLKSTVLTTVEIQGGTTPDYPSLTNLPSINGIILTENKTSNDLNLFGKPTFFQSNKLLIYNNLGNIQETNKSPNDIISKHDMLNIIYPIYSIYISTNSINPNILFDNFGTWESFATGRTLIGVDINQTEFNAPEKTGGEKSHALTTDENAAHSHSSEGHSHIIPGHSHSMPTSYNNSVEPHQHGGDFGRIPQAIVNGYNGNEFSTGEWSGYTGTSVSIINSSGGGQPHNNLQPYITVYMWRRIA